MISPLASRIHTPGDFSCSHVNNNNDNNDDNDDNDDDDDDDDDDDALFF